MHINRIYLKFFSILINKFDAKLHFSDKNNIKGVEKDKSFFNLFLQYFEIIVFKISI